MWSWNTVVAVVVLLMYPGALAASQQRPSSSSVDSAQRHVDVVREGFARWAPRIRDLVGKDDVVIAIWDGESMARDGVLYQNQYVWVFRMLGTKAIEVEVFLDLERYYDVLRRVRTEMERHEEMSAIQVALVAACPHTRMAQCAGCEGYGFDIEHRN